MFAFKPANIRSNKQASAHRVIIQISQSCEGSARSKILQMLSKASANTHINIQMIEENHMVGYAQTTEREKAFILSH